MERKKSICLWAVTIFFTLFAIVFIPSASSLLLLLSAAVFAPIPTLKDLFTQLLPKQWMRVLFVTILMVGAITSLPTRVQTIPQKETPPIIGERVLNSSTEGEKIVDGNLRKEDAEAKDESMPIPQEQTYIVNENSKVFHYPSCPSAKRIKDANRRNFFGTREELVNQGYKSCGRCNP